MNLLKKIFIFFIFIFISNKTFVQNSSEIDSVTIAILAKDKAHALPLFLKCIEHQTWPKNKTYLYVRTNNNNDTTVEILQNWLERVAHLYAGIYFDDSDVAEPIQQFGQHEWNATRFKVLGKIRNDSIVWAYLHHSHYFVVDCDNFIQPKTLESLMKLRLPIVAPFMIKHGIYYSNFHAAVDKNGYLEQTPLAEMIYNQVIKGIFIVPLVHCCYLIQYDSIPWLTYDDNSYRYEYVIFSDFARKNRVTQYLDNREMYGYISFAETQEDINKEPWIDIVKGWFNQ